MTVKIGLEVHIQLKTDSKLFCGCPTEADEPNTATCPVCHGLPGGKPWLNPEAVKTALRLALALECDIPERSVFVRKSYFYPDLPKDFQITQLEEPFAVNGKIKIHDQEIPVERIQIEEDPASMRVPKKSGKTVLIDDNRAGIPLCELVTPPVFADAKQARVFLEELMRLAAYMNAFDPTDGTMKTDVNVSVEGHPRVEVKNVTSFKGVERAIRFEIIRQETAVDQGGETVHETRGFDEDSGTTFSQRKKEVAEEYGYIEEPDIPPIMIDSAMIEEVSAGMPEPPRQREKRLVKEYGLTEAQASSLLSDRLLADQFEEVADESDPSLAATWYGVVQKVLNYNEISLEESGFGKEHMIGLIKLIGEDRLSQRGAELLLRDLVVDPQEPAELAEKKGLFRMPKEELKKIVEKIIEENPQAVKDIEEGKEKAKHFLVGKSIGATKARADEKEILEILDELLSGD